MSQDAENTEFEPTTPRSRTAGELRTVLAVGLAAVLVIVAIIGGGLAWAFLSFSRHTASPSPADSRESPSPAATITASSSAETTAVPDVVSLSLSAATKKLRGAGLEAGAVTRVFVDGFSLGAVVAQSPASAARAPLGSAVALTVSKGSLTAELPSVAGLTAAQAKSMLGSAGRAPVPMPGITGMTPAQATAACGGAGLGLTLRPFGASRGVVYRQSPAAGAGITPGSSASAWVDTPPSASVSAKLTRIDETWQNYNKALGAHVTCTSASSDERGIASYRWKVEGLDVSMSGTGTSISFVLPGYRRYGSTSVTLTVVDSAGQASTVRGIIKMNWDTGKLQ